MDDVIKTDEFKLPLAWIDKIFYYLDQIYVGKSHSACYPKELEYLQWASGLYNLTLDEIKHAIKRCQRRDVINPPSVVCFYHLAKNHPIPPSKANIRAWSR